MDATPPHEPPVDFHVLVVEERGPPRLDEEEQIAFEQPVARWCRQVPRQDTIAHDGDWLTGKLGAAELLEGLDNDGKRVARRKPHQVVQVPQQATVPGHANRGYRVTGKTPLPQRWLI